MEGTERSVCGLPHEIWVDILLILTEVIFEGNLSCITDLFLRMVRSLSYSAMSDWCARG